MTLSLILTNTYFVGTPDHATVTIQDNDELPAPGTIATLNAPMAIDYHPGNSSLIVSYNWLDGVSPHRLPCIFKGPFTAG